jgi:hypothetical protein
MKVELKKENIEQLQCALNMFINKMESLSYIMPEYLIVDGKLGKKTSEVHALFDGSQNGTLIVQKDKKPRLINTPTSVVNGESYFGGDKDKGDRTWGQSNLTKQCKTPYDIITQYKELLGLFDVDLIYAHKDKFPMTTDEKGNVKPAGLSYFLDEQAYFCALPLPLKAYGYTNNDCLRVELTNKSNGKKCIAIVTDFGPAKWTNRQLDVSPAIWKYLEINENKDSIAIETAGYQPLGPVKG